MLVRANKDDDYDGDDDDDDEYYHLYECQGRLATTDRLEMMMMISYEYDDYELPQVCWKGIPTARVLDVYWWHSRYIIVYI